MLTVMSSPASNQSQSDEVSDPSREGALQVLIADDHQDAAETLAMLLSLEGHVVDVAINGREALNIAIQRRPDVAILDIALPELDGYTLARRLRQMDTGSAMLILALTGYGDAQDKKRALVAGFDEHFAKPIDPSQLMARIGLWQRMR